MAALAMIVLANKTLALLQRFEFNYPPRKNMNPKNPPLRRHPKNELISSNGIAREIGRSTRAVIDTLVRLGIEPDQVLPGGTYYKRKVIAKVEKAMRAPNKAVQPETQGK